MFVDDETRILEGLRRSMHAMRSEWSMRFCSSGEDALQQLALEPADVVVSDMRMPGIDGSQFLAEVMRLYPEAIRFILSGQSEAESVIRSTRSAHRYLSKPCDATTLKAAIERSTRLKSSLRSDQVAAMVGSVGALPTPPSTYLRLRECLGDPESGVNDVVRILRMDVALTAQIVNLANSGFFGCREPVQTVERAVSFVGTEAISALVLGQELFSAKSVVALPGFSLERLGQHSFQTAAWARTVALFEGLPASFAERAFLAGVLHDIGRLVIATRQPPVTEREVWLSKTAERMGAQHEAVGAYLLGLWGFPEGIVEAVLWHHRPIECGEAALGLCGLIHIGDQLAHGRDSQQPTSHALEPEYLESLGLTQRWPVWQGLRADRDTTSVRAI
jgi:HD-like signal output (HDOD) protein